ncbi:MAG: hypothetical protein IT290_00990 [Deltaproteobacteria bacterium]|nr:hypothetical protein [Deltaproteobacteria bacterium]
MGSNCYRDLRLAEIVADELELILCSAEDTRVSSLHVARVTPEPGGKKFICELVSDAESDLLALQHVVDRASSYLRDELVEALKAKKAPTFLFVVVPPLEEYGV